MNIFNELFVNINLHKVHLRYYIQREGAYNVRWN